MHTSPLECVGVPAQSHDMLAVRPVRCCTGSPRAFLGPSVLVLVLDVSSGCKITAMQCDDATQKL